MNKDAMNGCVSCPYRCLTPPLHSVMFMFLYKGRGKWHRKQRRLLVAVGYALKYSRDA
jgi:hypothetical protein